jgi:vancomycin permeability regulator SanA
VILGSVLWVRATSGPHRYAAGDVPAAPVALVLGAQAYADGTPSPFLAARPDVARDLYARGRVRAILVTQAYHLARAVALCRVVGIGADGMGGTTQRFPTAWHRGAVREYPAQVKAAWDALTRPEPTFLGPREDGLRRAVRGS